MFAICSQFLASIITTIVGLAPQFSAHSTVRRWADERPLTVDPRRCQRQYRTPTSTADSGPDSFGPTRRARRSPWRKSDRCVFRLQSKLGRPEATLSGSSHLKTEAKARGCNHLCPHEATRSESESRVHIPTVRIVRTASKAAAGGTTA